MATFSDVCWSGLVSAGTPSFVLDPTTVTPALSSSTAQFDFRILNVNSREERINFELRLGELLLGSTVLSGHDFFLECAHAEREREREREREGDRERETRQNLPLA